MKGFSITYYHFVKRLLIPDAHNKKLRMYESEDIVKKEPLDAAKQEPQDQATQKKLEDAVVSDPYLEGTVVTVQCLKPKEIAWEEPPDADVLDGPASVINGRGTTTSSEQATVIFVWTRGRSSD